MGMLHNVACAEAYLRTKWHLDPSSRLATIDMGRKLEGCASFLGTGAGSPSNRMSLGPRPTSLLSGILILPAVWPQQIWAENWGRTELCPFGGGGTGSPSNTVWPGPRSTFVLSFILVHPTVWPQYTDITDRQHRRDITDRTDSGPIA